ncbi:hypothetical protein K438DRAFT_1748205 [Mycena galopus ATCC 62051]|nr:hypothetical protein K438DRAFT_1748205 [Mycena galopus ATCC 62051]
MPQTLLDLEISSVSSDGDRPVSLFRAQHGQPQVQEVQLPCGSSSISRFSGGVGGDGGDGGQQGGKGGLGEGSVFPIGARQSFGVDTLIIGSGVGGTGGNSGIPYRTIQDSQTPQNRRAPTRLEQILDNIGKLRDLFTAATEKGSWLFGGKGGQGGQGSYRGGEGGVGGGSHIPTSRASFFNGIFGGFGGEGGYGGVIGGQGGTALRNHLFKQGFVTVGGLFEVTDHDLRNHLEIGHILTLKEKLHDFVRHAFGCGGPYVKRIPGVKCVCDMIINSGIES